MTTKIEWTNETWNPITGCSHASEGCQNCYAEKMHKRLTAMGQKKYSKPFNQIVFHKNCLASNIKGKNKMIFVNSMSDTFHRQIMDEEIQWILDECEFNNWNYFQILTKRAERLPDFVYPKNVWLGVTVENSKYTGRIELLKQTNATVKFLSCEPLLGDLGELDLRGIDWVIAGGESGRNARPCNPVWIKNIQQQCEKQGVPFFFKQWGEWLPAQLNLFQKEPHYITITPHETIEHQGVVKSMPLDFIKRKYNIFSWESGLAHIISIKVGKGKSGALLDGKEYKEFPKIMEEK